MGMREVGEAVGAVDARYQVNPVPFAAALGMANGVMWWFIAHSWVVSVTTGLLWFVLWGWAAPRQFRRRGPR